jgi:hypothetical protein
MSILPATGATITMGRVYTSYTNTAPTVGSNIRLSATLGPYGGKSATVQISFSSTFGNKNAPYTY